MFSDHVKTPLKRWYFSFKLDLFFPHEQYLKSPDHICFIFQYKSYSPSNTIWNISIYSLLSLVRKWVPWISRKMSWRQVEQGFGMLHFEKSSNLAKKWRKSLFNLPSTHFPKVLQVPEIRVSGTSSTTSHENERSFIILYTHIWFEKNTYDQIYVKRTG